MRVRSLRALQVALPLRRRVKHASHARTSTDNILVRVELASGFVGWGEGVPRDYVTGETAATSFTHFHGSELKRQLTPCATWAEALALAERLELAPVPNDARGIATNAARCALELALLDAYGRHFGESLTGIPALLAPELAEVSERVQYSGVILSARGWKARVAAVGQRVYGFDALKVKVGIAGQSDARRLRTVRRCVGPPMDLRVDANEAWPPGEVAARVRELTPARVSSVEQPVRHGDIEVLREARASGGIDPAVGFVLDESLCSMRDAERAVKLGTGEAFNLRLSKCGGFIPTLRLAQFAARAGLWVQLGCQVGESGILSAAGRHFATSVRGIRHREGSYDRRLLFDWLTEEDITFGRGGWAPRLTGPGLAVTPDPVRLAVHTVRSEVVFGP